MGLKLNLRVVSALLRRDVKRYFSNPTAMETSTWSTFAIAATLTTSLSRTYVGRSRSGIRYLRVVMWVISLRGSRTTPRRKEVISESVDVRQ